MERIGALLVACLVLGCAEDPRAGRLEVGSEAIAYSDAGDVAGLADLPKGEGIPGMYEGTFAVIPAGTRVRVIADESGPVDPERPETRRVRVSVLEGEYRGKLGTIERKQLRPIR